LLPSFSYQNSYTDTNELDSSYFRRQPASILSTGKSTEPDLGARCNWIGQQTQTQSNNNSNNYQTESRYESDNRSSFLAQNEPH